VIAEIADMYPACLIGSRAGALFFTEPGRFPAIGFLFTLAYISDKRHLERKEHINVINNR
jgi:hypothetical protein